MMSLMSHDRHHDDRIVSSRDETHADLDDDVAFKLKAEMRREGATLGHGDLRREAAASALTSLPGPPFYCIPLPPETLIARPVRKSD